MSMGDTAESDLLKLLFQNTNWANLGDATGLRGSTVAGSFFVSLHTAALTDTSTQTTSEAVYGAYVRQAVARSSGGWTIAGTNPTTVSNAAAINFPQCTSGSETEQAFAVGRDTSAAGEIIVWGALTSNLAVSTGITPSFAIGALTCTVD